MQQDFSDAEREQDRGGGSVFSSLHRKFQTYLKVERNHLPCVHHPAIAIISILLIFFKETFFRLLILSAQTGKHENTSYIFVSFDLSIDMYVCTRDARQIVFFTEGGIKSLKASHVEQFSDFTVQTNRLGPRFGIPIPPLLAAHP